MSEEKLQTSKIYDYYSDPNYKKKHNKYMTEKTLCSCGCNVIQSNMSQHKKNKKTCKINEITTV